MFVLVVQILFSTLWLSVDKFIRLIDSYCQIYLTPVDLDQFGGILVHFSCWSKFRFEGSSLEKKLISRENPPQFDKLNWLEPVLVNLSPLFSLISNWDFTLLDRVGSKPDLVLSMSTPMIRPWRS